MKRSLFFFLLTIFTFFSHAQTICGTVGEGQTLTLTAPAGKVFVSVTFASYGTPNGSCGSFSTGACHASNSMTIVSDALLGNNSASIDANNAVFGDPCGGTVKSLSVEAIYGTALPLKLISFSGIAHKQYNELHWRTSGEINCRSFDVERSLTGNAFTKTGSLAAINSSGENNYSFFDNTMGITGWTYRLKMQDNDGRTSYSSIIKLTGTEESKFEISPVPATDKLTIKGLSGKGMITITDMQGTLLKQVQVTEQVTTVDISAYSPGMYFVKYSNNQAAVTQRIIKQ